MLDITDPQQFNLARFGRVLNPAFVQLGGSNELFFIENPNYEQAREYVLWECLARGHRDISFFYFYDELAVFDLFNKLMRAQRPREMLREYGRYKITHELVGFEGEFASATAFGIYLAEKNIGVTVFEKLICACGIDFEQFVIHYGQDLFRKHCLFFGNSDLGISVGNISNRTDLPKDFHVLCFTPQGLFVVNGVCSTQFNFMQRESYGDIVSNDGPILLELYRYGIQYQGNVVSRMHHCMISDNFLRYHLLAGVYAVAGFVQDFMMGVNGGDEIKVVLEFYYNKLGEFEFNGVGAFVENVIEFLSQKIVNAGDRVISLLDLLIDRYRENRFDQVASFFKEFLRTHQDEPAFGCEKTLKQRYRRLFRAFELLDVPISYLTNCGSRF